MTAYSEVRIFFCTTPTDMHYSFFFGLRSLVVASRIGVSPLPRK